MAGVEKISVALTTEMVATMREAVAAGEYASTGDVMREAMQDWTHRRTLRTQAVDELRQLWDEGLATPSIDGDEAIAEIRSQIAAGLASRRA